MTIERGLYTGTASALSFGREKGGGFAMVDMWQVDHLFAIGRAGGVGQRVRVSALSLAERI